MSESIKDMSGGWPDNRSGGWLRRLFEAAKTELDALRTLTTELKTDNDAAVADIAALRAAIVGITAKLDSDAGVTDTNYAATQDPAAQTSTTIAAAAAVETLTS